MKEKSEANHTLEYDIHSDHPQDPNANNCYRLPYRRRRHQQAQLVRHPRRVLHPVRVLEFHSLTETI